MAVRPRIVIVALRASVYLLPVLAVIWILRRSGLARPIAEVGGSAVRNSGCCKRHRVEQQYPEKTRRIRDIGSAGLWECLSRASSLDDWRRTSAKYPAPGDSGNMGTLQRS